MADLNKIVEDLSSLTVLEAAELSKMLEEKWGVSAAAPVAVAAAPTAGGGEAAAEEKTADVESKKETEAAPQDGLPDPVAEVNGSQITAVDFREALKRYERPGLNIPEERLGRIKKSLLNRLVDDALIEQGDAAVVLFRAQKPPAGLLEAQRRIARAARVRDQRRAQRVQPRPPVFARLGERRVRQHVVEEELPRHGRAPARLFSRLQREAHALVQDRRRNRAIVARRLVLEQEGERRVEVMVGGGCRRVCRCDELARPSVRP